MVTSNVPAAIVGGVLFLTGVVVDETSLVPIGSAVAVMSGVWWIGRKLQRMEDDIKALSESVKQLRCVRERSRTCPEVNDES